MKTSNLIISLSLCSLLLSPASIFGMKKEEDSDKDFIIVTVDDSNKKKETNKENILDSTEIKTTSSSSLSWTFVDLFRNPKTLVISSLKNNTYYHTSGLKGINMALRRCFLDKDYTSLTCILGLCKTNKIFIADDPIIKQCLELLEIKKRKEEKIFIDKLNQNYTNDSKCLNKELEKLKKDFVTVVDTLKKMTSNYEFKKSDENNNKATNTALKYLQNTKRKLTKQTMLAFTGNTNEKKEEVAAFLNKYRPDGKKITENTTYTNALELMDKLKKKIEPTYQTVYQMNKKLSEIPPMKAIIEQQYEPEI